MVKGASELPALREPPDTVIISFTPGNLWPSVVVIQAHTVSHLGPIRIQQDFFSLIRISNQQSSDFIIKETNKRAFYSACSSICALHTVIGLMNL